MTEESQHWRTSRNIVERIVVTGDLILETPAHFGSGDLEAGMDLELLRDARDGAAFLPGASVAGALRNYWRERTRGYGAPAKHSALFGGQRFRQGDMEGEQSLLIVDDAFGPPLDDGSYPEPQIELRDGVKIRSDTRTAEEDKLFGMEMLRAGTTFCLRFELLVPHGQGEDLRRDLAVALEGFEARAIALGARKRRGFGQGKVHGWHVWRYDLTTPHGLVSWLAEGWEGGGWQKHQVVEEKHGASIAALLDVSTSSVSDLRHCFEMEATFRLDGSLLVRSGQGEAEGEPDTAHLHRTDPDEEHPGKTKLTPVLPGTSLAGVLRARALRIANTIGRDRQASQRLVSQMFGVGPEDPEWKDEEQRHASRMTVREAELKHVHKLVQTRIRVDRFTGGAMDNYLFSEAPVFSGPKSRITLNLALRNPQDHEIGLLLLLLKDLWTGDLPVGGESSVGRGRLKGVKAKLTHNKNGKCVTRTLSQVEEDDRLHLTSDIEEDAWRSLERFVTDLTTHLAGGR